LAEFPAILGATPGQGVAARTSSSLMMHHRRQAAVRLTLSVLKWLALAALTVFVLGPLIVMAI
jgi:hypothetical protein